MPLINVGLAKNPINWLVVIMMLVLAAVGGHLVFSYFGIEPATDEG